MPSAPVDSTRVVAAPVSSFEFISRDAFLRRHAFSLDHFLELMPDGVVARLGPIGNEAFYSRWGIGRGRALVVANGIPLNDPQDGTAPFVHVATSGIASLTMDAREKLTFAPAAEGSITLRDLVPMPDRPHTFIELTKATNELRQRRVRFGSEAGRVGLDLSYDEVLDDGYDFNADDLATFPSGAANTRNAGAVLRGDLTERTRYDAGIRRFRSSTTGDLESAANEGSRSGHLAWAGVGMGSARAVIYGRGYNATRPDSNTTNESVGGTVSWNLESGGQTLHMFALGERTNATQLVGTGEARSQVTQGNAGASTELTRGGFAFFGHGVVGGDTRAFAWGAGAGVRHDLPLGDVTLFGQRTFRMPTIGERYLPEHVRDGFLISGRQTLDPETALEGSADWNLRRGGLVNRVRASWMRSRDYITFAPVSGDPASRRAANSGDEPTMTFFEERAGLTTHVGAVEMLADAGGRYTSGDRAGLFLSVPRTQASASLLFGMQFFEKSSALYLGGEYEYSAERRDYNGVVLDSFNVVNVSLVARLVDARFYAKWLNVLDEQYQTVSGYLMTPQTLEYGIEWTLFD
ncbi:MAG TPA: TonB-dependent receptor [Candidatus Krumholzibacteria bacterium]|nr:TonB-dependent receptor [Candidatus Krumholzibacteria bacterium]